jgi:cystathionine beta-lyase
MVAAHAAYAHCEDWLDELRAYLTANRDLVFDFVERRLPQVSLTLPEATYLAWLDLRGLGLDTPYKFVLKEAKVALGDGAGFGQGGEGFVRLNFGTPRTLLQQGLDQIAAALAHAIA